MKITLKRGDITEEQVEAVVNAANSSLLGGGGVDGAIHRKGGKTILEECRAIRARQGRCPTGEAVYTTAGLLPASYVIHTVGPVWQGGGQGEAQLLYNSYQSALRIAEELTVKTVAFPNISTGVYGYPKPAAANIAIRAVREFLEHIRSVEEVRFVCFEEENYAIYTDLLKD